MNNKKLTIMLSLIAVGGISACAFTWFNRLQPITSYEGITLSDTKADVQYKLGPPSDVSVSDAQIIRGVQGSAVYQLNNDIMDGNMPIPKDYDWHDANQWSYRDYTSAFNPETDVYFRNGKVLRIECYEFTNSSDPNSKTCPMVYGFSPEATEDQIRAKLGEPNSVKTTDGFRRIVYERLNISFDFSQMELFATYFGQPPSNWDP